MNHNGRPYTAQTVSTKLTYQRPDGTALGSDVEFLQVLMVVKPALKNRPIAAPGSIQFEVTKPEWGDQTPSLEPVTDFYTADQVNAQGEGIGSGVKDVVGTLKADTPYYVVFGGEVSTDRDLSGSKICAYEENPDCIPLEEPKPAAS